MAIANPTYYTVKGNTDIIQLADKRTWNLTDGVQTFKRFAGTADAIKAKFNELSAATDPGVDDIQEDIEGKGGRLICRVFEDSGSTAGGNTEALNAVWEVIAQDVMKPIETHSDFDSINTLRKRNIENYVKDKAKAVSDGITAPSGAAELSLAGYFAYQVLDFPLTELLLRKSTILSTKSAITASYTNMNRVVTLASINPPTMLLGVLTSLPKMSGVDGAWEWLKKTPQIRQVEKRKFQLVYTWHGVERWAEIYGGSWTPVWSE